MSDPPRNAASDRANTFVALTCQPDRLPEVDSMVSDDFTSRDRRKIIGGPDLDKASLEHALRYSHELGRSSSHTHPVAVRGDRSALTRVRVEYKDGSAHEYLSVIRFDQAVDRLERVLIFDVDDEDIALAELDLVDEESDDRATG